MSKTMWREGYEDAYAMLEPKYPKDTEYMNGYFDAEIEMDEEDEESYLEEI